MSGDTVIIQVGNSDDRLSQYEWALFIAELRSVIEQNVVQVHFSGGSDWCAPWQNACWVCQIADDANVEQLIEKIQDCRGRHRQDAVAVTVGTTRFV